jgi:hypothetical protein
LKSVEFRRQIGADHKLLQLEEKLNEQLALRAKGSHGQAGITSAITFQDFVNVVSAGADGARCSCLVITSFFNPLASPLSVCVSFFRIGCLPAEQNSS